MLIQQEEVGLLQYQNWSQLVQLYECDEIKNIQTNAFILLVWIQNNVSVHIHLPLHFYLPKLLNRFWCIKKHLFQMVDIYSTDNMYL